MKKLLLLTALLFISFPALAQKSLTTLDVANVESFTAFEGRGFASAPLATQVDSDEFAVDGVFESATETYCLFGDDCPTNPEATTDFSRGISEGNEAGLTGGVYSFDHTTGAGEDYSIGWKAKSGNSPRFTPGDLIVKYRNDTMVEVDQFDVSYEFWYINSDAGSHILSFSWKTGACADTLGEGTYTAVPALDSTTPGDTAADPEWVETVLSTTVLPGPVADGECFYAKFTGDFISGGGNQDEVAIDDISVTPKVQSLAVELTSFEAIPESRDVVLSWLTASSAGGGFEVQELNGGWTTVATIDGGPAGAFTHRIQKVAPGRHAYRLKMLDTDGSVSYSQQIEVAIDLEKAFDVTHVYPSPILNTGTFSVAVARDQHVTVDVFDILGRRVSQLHDGVMGTETEYRMTVNAESLTSGLYIIRVSGENFLTTRSVVVSH